MNIENDDLRAFNHTAQRHENSALRIPHSEIDSIPTLPGGANVLVSLDPHITLSNLSKDRTLASTRNRGIGSLFSREFRKDR